MTEMETSTTKSKSQNSYDCPYCIFPAARNLFAGRGMKKDGETLAVTVSIKWNVLAVDIENASYADNDLHDYHARSFIKYCPMCGKQLRE